MSPVHHGRRLREPARVLPLKEVQGLLEEAFTAARVAGDAEEQRLKCQPLGTWQNPWGAAWITLRPARGAIVSALKKKGIGHVCCGGGYRVPFGSGPLAVAKVSAEAFAALLTAHGFVVSSHSAID